MNIEEALKDYGRLINSYMYKAYGIYSLNNFIELEDYKQEIYIHLMKYLPKYDSSKASISTFLFRLITLKSHNIRKMALCNPYKANYGAYSLENKEVSEKDNDSRDTKSCKESIMDTVTSTEDRVEGKDFFNYVYNAYPKDRYYQEVLRYRFLGYSKLQTSKFIGRSRQVVENRLKLAREKANEYLGGSYGAN